MDSERVDTSKTWRSAQQDLTDEEWALVVDLFEPDRLGATVGRPVSVSRRAVVDAILFVMATGCQWRALPACYPNWNTVHRNHLAWSRDGTWEAAATRLAGLLRTSAGRHCDPSVGIVDARTVRGAATVTSPTRGYDAGKKISGRKTFGVVDTMGLLIAVFVVAASTPDNNGGIVVAEAARQRSSRLTTIFCDAGFKTVFAAYCQARHLTARVVNRIHPGIFEPLPKRWIVERTWSWLTNNRRLQIDYERCPEVTEGFIWAAETRHLLRRLTT